MTTGIVWGGGGGVPMSQLGPCWCFRHTLQHFFFFFNFYVSDNPLDSSETFNSWSHSAHCQSLHPRGSFPSMGTLVVAVGFPEGMVQGRPWHKITRMALFYSSRFAGKGGGLRLQGGPSRKDWTVPARSSPYRQATCSLRKQRDASLLPRIDHCCGTLVI